MVYERTEVTDFEGGSMPRLHAAGGKVAPGTPSLLQLNRISRAWPNFTVQFCQSTRWSARPNR